MHTSYITRADRATVHREAEYQRRRGWAVFPVRGKAPQTPRGFYDASTDQARVTAMFNAARGATGYGVRTGEASGIVVVDVDGPEARVEAERMGLRSGHVVRSGRTEGDGWHVYLTIPRGVKLRTCDLAPGVQLKAEGGYVVGAGSVHPSGQRYTVAKDGDPSPAPDWILEASRSGARRQSRSSAGTPSFPVSIDMGNLGPPIAEGGRNREMTRVCGRLHDGTRDLDQLLDDLLAINDARCTPPLPETEIRSIATSIHRKTPCTPPRRSQEDPAVAEVLEEAGRYWYARLLPGGGRSKVRDVFRACLGIAAKHGSVVTVRVEGSERRAVRFSASCRQVAPPAGTTPMSVSRAVKRLRELGAMRRDDAERGDADSGTLLVVEPAQSRYTHINLCPTERVDDGCNSSARPPRPDRLCTPAPRWGDHVGNARAGTLYALEAFGPQTAEQLADRVGMARARDLMRRHLEPLEALGLIERRGDRWALVGAYTERTGEIAQEPYSTLRLVRRRRDTVDGRRVTFVAEQGAVASREERDRIDRKRYADETAAFRDRRLRPIGRAPSNAELRAHRESYAARRREAIGHAIARLFADRPEYRARRVGQVTCALHDYLDPDYPRGADGYPKDAEVEAILDGALAKLEVHAA